MLVETLVFSGQNGVFHDIRDFPDGHDRPPFLPEFAQELALGRDDPQGDFRLVVGQRLERRERRPQQRQHERAQQRADDAQAERDRDQIEDPAL